MTITVDPSELKQVNDIRTKFAEITQRYGALQLAKRRLEKELIEVEDKYEELMNKERSLIEGLDTRYGVGNLNVETGEFTPQTSE